MTETTETAAETSEAATETQTAEWTPPASQDELNKIVNAAVARTHKKYGMTPAEAAAARTELEQVRQANQTELQRAQEAAQQAQDELTTLRTQSMRTAAARAAGLDADMEQFLTGQTEEDLATQAATLAARIAAAEAPRAPGPNTAQGTSAGSASAAELSPAQFMNQQLRTATGRGI